MHNSQEGLTSGIIAETEAYMGVNDRASHTYGGRRTRRTETLYGPPGTLYVYLAYGIHSLLNIVVGPEGVPMAVLLRSLVPLEGLELMAKRRGITIEREKDVFKLCRGPGNLTRAMGITVEHNSIDITGDTIYIVDIGYRDFDVGVGTRIGVDYAGEDELKPWRFYFKNSPYVSKKH